MRRTLARADEIARGRGHGYVGTEHVVLALLDDPGGIAGGTIARLGYEPAIRSAVIGIIESEGYDAGATSRPADQR